MNVEATTKAQYENALTRLDLEPIVGRHTIGKLSIDVSAKAWRVYDGLNAWSGPGRTGAGLRNGVAKAVKAWIKQQGITF